MITETWGSILGPLLFLLYVNDLQSVCLFSSPFSFADDFKLLRSLRSEMDVDLLQRDLDYLSDWCSQWNLKLSCPKCVCMRYACWSLSCRITSLFIPASV